MGFHRRRRHGTWTNLPGANAAGGADGNSGSGCQCGYDQTIGVDPTTDQTVYIGFQEVWKSTNGGTSFGGTAITLNQVHWDNHAFTFSPHDATGQTFYIGTDGGVATTTNGAFTNINGTTSFSNGAIAANLLRGIDIGRGSNANRLWTYGGFQDTGNSQFGSGYTGTTWQLGQDGDGGPMTVDPCNPLHAITTDDGGYSQTTTGGTAGSWSGTVTLSPAVPGGFNLSGSAFAFDQTCDTTVYAGFNISDPTGVTPTTFGLYQSTDNGNTYTEVDTLTNSVSSIATAKIDPNVVWIGLNNGSLAFSTNALLGAASTWTAIPDPSGTGQSALGIAMDPNNTATVFAVYPGVNGTSPSKHVWMTTDSGTHWTDISGTGADALPDLPLQAVAVDPSSGSNPRTIIVGGEAGVFQTTNNGATWQVLGVGLPTVGVTGVALDSSVSPSLLRVGTYGRSSFELGAATGPLLAINTTQNFGTICPSQSPTTLLQLFNVGASALTITNIQRISGSTDFTITGPSFPTTIAAGEEVDWTIKLAVTSSSTNPESATFAIDSNDSVNPTQDVTYTATVGAPNGSTVIAGGGNYGNVCLGSFADLNLTINNSGTCNLLVSGMVSSDPDFLTPSTLSYPLTVHSGGSITAPVRFEPLSLGTFSGIVTADSTNNPGGNMSVNVSGVAPPGHITWSGAGTFGNICANTNAQQTITIGNTGLCNLHVTSATINCSNFTIEGNPFPATLSPDSSLPLTIAFTPTSLGAKSCNLTIDSDDPINPILVIPLTGNTPGPVISLNTAGLTLPPTVIQNRGSCHSQVGLPIANSGQCGLTINSVGITGPDAADYSLTGLPALPDTVGAGDQLGDGDLDAVFAPSTIARTKTASVNVPWVNDPILHTTTTQSVPLCGEATGRGVRVLVTNGGVPVATVRKVTLYYVNQFGFQEPPAILIQRKVNLPLATVTGTAPCPTFQYHYEFGTVSNETRVLKPGNYLMIVTIVSGGHVKTKSVKVNLNTCDFDKNIVVAF